MNSEDLQIIAMRGEKAARLLENDDFIECLTAFKNKCAAEELEFLPGQAGLWALKRNSRLTIDDIFSFLEGVKSEGDAARKEQQGISPEKRIIM